MGNTKVEWTNNALRNLSKIHTYIAEDSPIFAQRFLTNLVLKTDKQLSSFPDSGRKIPEFETTSLSSLRELIYKGYRILYDPTDIPLKVTILTVISGRMDLETHQKNNWIIE